MPLDIRLGLLIVLCVIMLLTIEVTEDYVEQDWPRLRRPPDGWSHAEALRMFWTGVGLLVFPGLVLVILNLALLIAQDLPQTPVQVLGGFLVLLGWAIFVAVVSQFGALSDYIEDLGPVAPLAVSALLVMGDLLLLIELLGLIPNDLRALLP
ncbi:hypothetical protein NET02_01920 [Thermomicrobiaceae bacterium CFH 74404]|uniref:Uncharacterized protein n=2 Tax=Thermomicrobia TaxID=189775 RepID=A0AA42B9Z8_9BACT|nr:hypothetical protein [Thermalbibacter longus]MCM8747899.1 hypothetical protein [Thermalbibacter longus]